MLVTDRRRCRLRTLEEQLQLAAEGGLRLIQIRDPGADELSIASDHDRLSVLCPEATWILNDHPRLARARGCGLHLPARRPPWSEKPRPRPYGRSVHDESELRSALAEAPDYLIAGTIYATVSKPGFPGRGVEWLARAAGLAGSTPVYAIGGITLERLPEVLAAGAHGVAVCGALLEASDPAAVVKRFNSALHASSG